MDPSRLKYVAGGGLIDRRSFLQSGLRYSAAGAMAGVAATSLSTPAISATVADSLSAPPSASSVPVGARLPSHMRTLGAPDSVYGSPSVYEASVQRRLSPTTPQTEGFSLWHNPLAQQRGIITPSGLHFSVHHNGIPDIPPDSHVLMIHGMVEKPLRFDLQRIERYPMVSRIHFLECSGNTAANALSPTALDADCQELFGQVSCSEWTGIPLRLLLQEAGIREGAKWAIVEGADGGSHARSLPLEKLLDDALIALYQNGERLRPSQGYPMRLFVPGWEGNVNVKWVHRIEITDTPAFTKDESGLYSEVLDNGKIERFTFPMAVKSVITHPSGKQYLPEIKGFYEIAGFAWSGHGRIRSVDISADGGETWATAQLHAPVLDRAFTQFSIPWQWNGKSSVLMSRATDEKGHVQPTRTLWKQKYAAHSFNHYNAIQTWKVHTDGRVENVYV